ncbi:MAG: S-formylglutathione hydrolase [Woeseiaceae bacterium]|nr:S-formylglutathione hydrolase [Woeseiaceae bacterium]|tara:strand:+ start:376 stop:1230 length:855 start_codon:yes stop_codon:yes gene_type:complete
MIIETLSETGCFGGKIGFYRHASTANNCDMQFSVFVPPQAALGKVPVLTFLSGLTCTEENFMAKSGAQRIAAELGLMLVSPDTSPRGDGVPDDPDGSYDFGLGAGFYVNSTEQPFSQHYQMYDYVTQELQQIIFDNFPGDRDRHGLTGHSMGGHGALTIGLRNPDIFNSLSAFAPICTTLHSPWGKKAMDHYLGDDTATWAVYDSCEIARNVLDPGAYRKILVDQGAADPFLVEQLRPELLKAACEESGLALELRIHDGYDHGYYFISTFIEEHLRFHADQLKS